MLHLSSDQASGRQKCLVRVNSESSSDSPKYKEINLGGREVCIYIRVVTIIQKINYMNNREEVCVCRIVSWSPQTQRQTEINARWWVCNDGHRKLANDNNMNEKKLSTHPKNSPSATFSMVFDVPSAVFHMTLRERHN